MHILDFFSSSERTFIGFSQRTQTVPEDDGDFATDGYYVTIPIHSVGSERRDYPVLVRVTTTNNSTVEGITSQFDPSYDALFGSRYNSYDPLEENFNLETGEVDFELSSFVQSDFVPEGLECFTLQLIGMDSPGFRDISVCNEDHTDSTDYFCRHTICIEDDDG